MFQRHVSNTTKRVPCYLFLAMQNNSSAFFDIFPHMFAWNIALHPLISRKNFPSPFPRAVRAEGERPGGGKKGESRILVKKVSLSFD